MDSALGAERSPGAFLLGQVFSSLRSYYEVVGDPSSRLVRGGGGNWGVGHPFFTRVTEACQVSDMAVSACAMSHLP